MENENSQQKWNGGNQEGPKFKNGLGTRKA